MGILVRGDCHPLIRRPVLVDLELFLMGPRHASDANSSAHCFLQAKHLPIRQGTALRIHARFQLDTSAGYLGWIQKGIGCQAVYDASVEAKCVGSPCHCSLLPHVMHHDALQICVVVCVLTALCSVLKESTLHTSTEQGPYFAIKACNSEICCNHFPDCGKLQWHRKCCRVAADKDHSQTPQTHQPFLHYDIPAKSLRSVVATFVIGFHAQRANASIRNVSSLTKAAIRTKCASWRRPHILRQLRKIYPRQLRLNGWSKNAFTSKSNMVPHASGRLTSSALTTTSTWGCQSLRCPGAAETCIDNVD